MVRPHRSGHSQSDDGNVQLTRNTTSSSNHGDCTSVAAVAASSVDGYLRNASRRLRVPAAEGGRGTRRKADMVTSKTTIKKDALASLLDEEQRDKRGMRTNETVPAVDADDEWDEVELCLASSYTAVKKNEDDAHTSIISKGEPTKAFKSENDIGQQQQEQEQQQAVPSPPTGVKLEHLQQQQLYDPVTSHVDGLHSSSSTAALHASNNSSTPGGDQANEDAEEVMMRGTRPPLIEQQQQNDFDRWHRNDPAYAALIEQRDLLAAQRRSERIQATCKSIVELMSVVIRGRMIWREAHHPHLVKQLLQMRATSRHHKSARSENDLQSASPRLSTASLVSHAVQPEYYFLHAVIAAHELLQRAGDPSACKRSLAPTWVTLSKDGLGNATSQAILVLLRAINDHFELCRAVPAADAAAEVDSQDNQVEDGYARNAVPSLASTSSPPDRHLFTWHSALKRRYLTNVLQRSSDNARRDRDVGGKATTPGKRTLSHPVYFCVMFLALAHLSGMPCRLVIAKGGQNKKSIHDDDHGVKGSMAAADSSTSDGGMRSSNTSRARGRTFLQKMSIFVGKSGHAAAATVAGDDNISDQVGSKRSRPSAAKAGRTMDDEVRSKRLPTSSFWVEVWSAERQCFTAVNPCASCTTLWAAPYTFSIDGVTAVDATARYSSKYSTAFLFNRRLGRCRQYGFLWKDTVAWDDHREVVEVLLLPFSTTHGHAEEPQGNGSKGQDSQSAAQAGTSIHAAAHEGKDSMCDTWLRRTPAMTTLSGREVGASLTTSLCALQHARETAQLESLKYAETVPNTLNALHHHPLFVIESDLARHEAVYPKNGSTIVASVKGRTVYKRSAVVSLRSVDGWLREGRSIRAGETPYKTAAPPTSRPFAQASQFFGYWQTIPFAPLPLSQPNDPIPHHGRTWWYILLDRPAPAGLAHLTQPQIVRVVRRMHADYGLAVTGFVRRRISERRRGHWEVIIDGVVIKESDRLRVERAYEEWVQLVQEQEATKRRNRACQWWLLMTQRLLATDRLQSQYLQGKQHGSLSMW